MPMDITGYKKRLRQNVKQQKAQLSKQVREEKSLLICERIVQGWHRYIRSSNSETITLFTYLPFGSEVDITPIIRWCFSRQVRVVVPKICEPAADMKLCVIRGFNDIEPGFRGIPEPKETAEQLGEKEAIQVMLVPGIAFDIRRGRLGYGGGYYDRFVRRYKREFPQEPVKIAPAFDIQIVQEVPMEEHDFRVDWIVTESRVIPEANAWNREE